MMYYTVNFLFAIEVDYIAEVYQGLNRMQEEILLYEYSVLRIVFTFNNSNTKKEGGFDSRIYVQITWYVQFFPLSALTCMIFSKSHFISMKVRKI